MKQILAQNRLYKGGIKMLKVTSLFSGIGAFEQALTNLGIEYELVNFCEIDKYAIKAYCEIHNIDESLNLRDITKIDLNSMKCCDLLTHGSPCTDYSISGKQQGGDEGSETRSSLMWNTVQIVNKIKPKYVIWENVKNVLSPKHKHNFDKYINKLEELGYNNYWQVLNAKNYSIPQNRERIFVVSIRKDIDKNSYIFPEKQELKLRLKDMLEDNVDEKYYINNDRTEKLLKTLKFKNIQNSNNIIQTLTSSSGGGGTNNLPKICEQRTDEGLRFFKDNVCGTIRTIDAGGDKRAIESNYTIRKLTPLECWRLMGFKDECFYKAKNSGISNTQLYKMAGNSIVVTVLEAIFKNLLIQ